MKNIVKKSTSILACLIIGVVILTGCGQTDNQNTTSNNNVNSDSASSGSSVTIEIADESSSSTGNQPESSEDIGTTASVLEVCFGDEGKPFTMNLYDNDTAMAIARHIGTADWRLPINHFDDYDNWEVMQYYDIPSRYEIPSNPDEITSAKAGEVYYSDPNRIVLFYQDAEVTGEYTRIGYFDPTEEFVAAVEDNPVLEGWRNKIVLIRTAN